jgi:galactokinase
MFAKEIITNTFLEIFNRKPEIHVTAPGRVNLIGEHTDYNQGFVFPVAINFGTQIFAAKRSDKTIRIIAADYEFELNQFELDEIEHVQNPSWSNYIRGVVGVLYQQYPQLQGADLIVNGDVPQGAGLSSSASFEVAIVKTFNELYGLKIDGVSAALISQKAENEFVGCSCGIMDQLISALGRKGKAMLLDCETLSYEHSVIDDNYRLLIINSNVKRGLVESEYNSRRKQCEMAAQIMDISSLRYATMTLLEKYKSILGNLIYRRAKHIVTENERTLAMFSALKNKNDADISKLMRQSHASMRDDFEITTPEIDYLVGLIDEQLQGRGGVRMTGGGFGGCVVALVPADLVPEVIECVEQNYQYKTGLKESIFVCTAEQGAF